MRTIVTILFTFFILNAKSQSIREESADTLSFVQREISNMEERREELIKDIVSKTQSMEGLDRQITLRGDSTGYWGKCIVTLADIVLEDIAEIRGYQCRYDSLSY